MKISEITPTVVTDFLRIEPEDADTKLIEAIQAAALSYIAGHTGIAPSPAAPGEESLDDYEDLSIAYLVLCQDMYDSRTMYPDAKYANAANKTVDSILALRRRNLL